MRSVGPFVVHVVAHTHWDREWYLPLARFRQRLVALVDELLDSPAPRGSFLLDGQAILLDDYLSVRPDREADLREALAAGTLEAGPWYVLADELLPSGEALVRNLLAGQRAVRARGGTPLSILYCPDSFGHPADLPALAVGFGFPLILLWRGLGGVAWPPGDAFRWRGAGDTSVVVHHLPPNGYEYGANLPTDEAQARTRWMALRGLLAPRARTGVLLVLNGADHHARQTSQQQAIEVLARVAVPDRVVASTLDAFGSEFTRQAAKITDLPEIEGELRFSPGYTWTVPGTWSSRAYQKRRNARIERMLTREAEPWSAIAGARGAVPRGPLLRAAWRTLLECHPHDTLCGCSSDAVAAAADARFTFAETEARGIIEDALLALVGHDADAARISAPWIPQVIVRNPSARARSGVAEVEITRFVTHEPVGPGSAGVAVEERELPSPALSEGRIPLQLLGRRIRSDRLDATRYYPDNDRVEIARCLAWVNTVAGYGIQSLSIDEAGSSPAPMPIERVSATASSLDNGLLHVELDGRDSLLLTSARTGHSWSSLVQFEDVGDAGDLYTYSPIEPTIRDARMVGARLSLAGPLRAELRLTFALELPVSSTPRGRSEKRVHDTVEIAVALDAGRPFLRVGVRGVNRARDHRLRIVFATGVTGGITLADAMFGPVRRLPVAQPPATRAMEVIPATAPLARWVSRIDDHRGMAVVSDGLGEYEARDDGSIAITLVRAVGALSRRDLPGRPGHAGWPVPTPGAQCIGPYRARFALFPHDPTDEVVGQIEGVADDFLLPLRGTTLRSAMRRVEPVAGLTLDGDGLRFLACKPSEDGDWTVLRCVNVTSRAVSGSWRCGWPLREAREARLDERVGDVLPVTGGHVPIVVPPREIATILVR